VDSIWSLCLHKISSPLGGNSYSSPEYVVQNPKSQLIWLWRKWGPLLKWVTKVIKGSPSLRYPRACSLWYYMQNFGIAVNILCWLLVQSVCRCGIWAQRLECLINVCILPPPPSPRGFFFWSLHRKKIHLNEYFPQSFSIASALRQLACSPI
jgi:hypothetical protein